MKKSVIPFLFLLPLALSGCSHVPRMSVEEQLDQKVALEPPVRSQADLYKESSRLIESVPGLSEAQRTKLATLRDSTRKESEGLQEKSFKLKAILIKDLLSSDYNSDEIDLIKKRIQDVEHERLRLFFSTVRNANVVLGRWGSKNEREQDESFDREMMLMIDFYRP